MTIQVGDTAFIRLELAMALFILMVVGTVRSSPSAAGSVKKVLAPRMRKKGCVRPTPALTGTENAKYEDDDPESR